MLHEKLKIFPDKALGSIDQDKFNRTGFVKVLVRAIRESSSHDGSTVLALLGPWGCGKTSIKNLAVKELEKGPTDPRVMEFCPWQVSGTGKITTLFFEALIAQISKENEVPDANSKRKNLRHYANLLSKGSTFIDVVANALSSVLHTGDTNPVIGAAAGHALSGSAKIASDILADLGKELPTDLIQLKRQISESLANLTRPILVVIDDIDRLPSEEIFEVIQIINVNADFPNLVYLLLFDRTAVERSIERSFEHRGRDFLEKIIQGSFHVPALSIDEIRGEFTEQLDLFIKGNQLEHSIDPQRLSELFFDVLWQYLGNVRHIKRLFSSLSFYIAQLSSENVLEVDLVDLIGIETLRLSETDIYEALPRYKAFLTDSEMWSGNIPKLRKIDDDSKPKKLEEILRFAQEKAKEKVERLLIFLFPCIVENYRDENESLVKRRVSRAENFYRYFTFRPAFNEVSELEVQSLLLSTVSPPDAEKLLQSFVARGAFGELLVRIDAIMKKLDQEQLQGLAIALVNFADRMQRGPESFLLDDVGMSQMVIQNIVKIVTSKRKDTKPRVSSTFSEIFQKSAGIIVPVLFCNGVRHALDSGETSSNERMTREELEQLARLVVTKIERMARDGEFKKHLHCAPILFFWSYWGDRNDVKSWISSTIVDKDGLFWILGLLSNTAEFHDSELPDNPFRFNVETIEKFADIEALRQSIHALDPTAISEKEQMLAKAFDLALSRCNSR